MKKITVTKDMALLQLKNMLDLVFQCAQQSSTDAPIFQTTVSLLIKKLQEMGSEELTVFHDEQMKALTGAMHYLTAEAILNEKLKKEKNA